MSGRDDELTRVRQRAQALAELVRASAVIQSSLDLGKILNTVIQESQALMNADAGSLMLLDRETNELVYRVSLGEVGKTIERFRLPVGRGIAGWVAETGQMLNIPDAYEDERFFRGHDEKTGYRTRSVLCVPLQVQGRIIGIAQVINKLPGGIPFTQEDAEIFQTFASVAAVAIDNARMHEEMLVKERLDRELEFAKEIQKSFLPQTFPEVSGLTFCARNVPALEVGGDFYDAFALADGRVGVVLGDVSGKGISAALYMARILSDLRPLAETIRRPDRLLYRLNNILAQRGQRGMFVTLCYLELDPRSGVFTLANAGHLPPLLRVGEETRRVEEAASPPMGILPNIDFQTARFPMAADCCWVFYTDGILEARGPGREQFGKRRLLDWMREGSRDPDPVGGLFAAVRTFRAGTKPHDDMTAVSVTVDRPVTLRTPVAEAARDVVTFAIPARPEYLPVVRAAVVAAAGECGFGEDDARKLCLAVDEGEANIIKHGYRDRPAGRIDVAIRVYCDRIEVDLRDDGPPINLHALRSRDLDDVRPGGLGLHLMHTLCDEVSYEPGVPEGNVLRLVKFRPSESPDGLGVAPAPGGG